MGFQDIEKKSVWYTILLNVVAPWHNFIFFRKVTINFRDRIPKDDHVIFTPNHQNALLDAIALLSNINRQLVFLARSDIFKKKRIARILYFLKILPVYRLRDGYSSIKRNNETFEKTVEVIKAKDGLVILPEGDYIRKHQLRPLKKGFARIAFQTEEANDFSLNLKIVPVGLHYSDYDNLRSDLIINFGCPVAVSDYYDLYKITPAIAINKLSAALKESLRSVMLDLPDEDYEMFYDLIKISKSHIQQETKTKLKNDLGFEQESALKLKNIQTNQPENFNELKNAFQAFADQLELTNQKKEIIIKSRVQPLFLILKTLGLLVGLPLFIYGIINNLIPYLFTESLVKKVKDVAFKNSFRFVISMLVFVIFYIIQIMLVLIFIEPWWFVILYTAILPFSLIFTIYYSKSCKIIYYEWKILFLKMRKPDEYKSLYTAYNHMIRIMNLK